MRKMEQMPEPISKLDVLPETAEEDLAADYFFDDEEDEDPACESNEAYNSLGHEEEEEDRYSDGYYDMFNAYKKELHSIVDKCHPAEWSYGMDMFITFIKFMKDFYHGGEGVWGMEQKDEDPIHFGKEPTREETLTKAIEYYNKWQNISDNYFRVLDCPKDEYGRNWKCEYRFKLDGKWLPSSRKVIKKWHKFIYRLEQKYKRKFLGIVNRYIESWWD